MKGLSVVDFVLDEYERGSSPAEISRLFGHRWPVARVRSVIQQYMADVEDALFETFEEAYL